MHQNKKIFCLMTLTVIMFQRSISEFIVYMYQRESYGFPLPLSAVRDYSSLSEPIVGVRLACKRPMKRPQLRVIDIALSQSLGDWLTIIRLKRTAHPSSTSTVLHSHKAVVICHCVHLSVKEWWLMCLPAAFRFFCMEIGISSKGLHVGSSLIGSFL